MDSKSGLAALVPQHSVTLNTDRLHLRPVRASDLQIVHEIRKNPKVMKYMNTGPETEEDPLKSQSFERIKIMTSPRTFCFAVQLKAPAGGDQDAEPVIGYMGVMRPPATGYIFDEPYWGKGYATEAYCAFLRSYWEKFPNGLPGMAPEDRDILIAYVHEGNRPSERVLEKAGLTFVGRESSKSDMRSDAWDLKFLIQRPTALANVAEKEIET